MTATATTTFSAALGVLQTGEHDASAAKIFEVKSGVARRIEKVHGGPTVQTIRGPHAPRTVAREPRDSTLAAAPRRSSPVASPRTRPRATSAPRERGRKKIFFSL
eukprot:31090-Pelagococcus_subviridis.AAC.6